VTRATGEPKTLIHPTSWKGRSENALLKTMHRNGAQPISGVDRRTRDHISRPQNAGGPQSARTSPRDSHSHDDLKVRFSATVGKEPEVEVALI
jgi:hypothetical protein